MQVLLFILFVAAFLISIFLSWYIPGKVLLGKINKTQGLAHIFLSLIVGMVLWGWQGYVFGYLHVRFLSYIYLIIFVSLYIFKRYYLEIKKIRIRSKNIDSIALLLTLIGTIGQNIFYYKTGFFTKDGMLSVGFNPPDHMWHTSLINEMVKRFPPNEPGMYGILVTNYHYWFNLITAELIRVFHLPLFHTQYQGMYILGSLLLGVGGYVLAMKLYPSRLFANLLLFFLYFGGDITYLFIFTTRHVFDFTVPLIIDAGYLFMDNPPRAYAVLIGIAAIYFLCLVLESKKQKYFFLLTLLIGSLVGFKIYNGITFIAGFSLLAFWYLFKKDWRFAFAVIGAVILSIIIFLPVNANSGGIMFLPFERPRDYITYKPLGFSDMELRWRVYLAHNNYLRLIEYGVLMSIIYVVSQFGLRVIGFVPYPKTYKILGLEKTLFFIGIVASSLVLGIFFSQRAHTADSFNFFLPSIFILSILTSMTVALFCQGKSKSIVTVIVLLIIVVTIPRFIYRVDIQFQSERSWGFVGFSNDELASYNFLKEHTPQDSLVLVKNESSLDSFSAIVSIFADRNMYLSGQGVLVAHDVLNKERVATVETIEKNKDPKIVNSLLVKNRINYLYFYGKPSLKVPMQKIHAKKVFANKKATIYKVLE